MCKNWNWKLNSVFRGILLNFVLRSYVRHQSKYGLAAPGERVREKVSEFERLRTNAGRQASESKCERVLAGGRAMARECKVVLASASWC